MVTSWFSRNPFDGTVAAALGVSVKTVDAHRANVMHKLDLHSVTDLVRYAIRNQIIEA